MKYLKLLFPFLLTLALWRLSVPFWNPAGILALIPIFYFTFVRPRAWFVPFGVIASFLIDYKMGTVLFWTIIYLIAFAVNEFQTWIDVRERAHGAIFFWIGFIAIGLIILTIQNMSFPGLFANFWLFLWLVWWYFVFVILSREGGNPL